MTAIKVGGLNTPEGIACGSDARLFVAESALFQAGVGRRISRIDHDGSNYTVVLDFASTPELAMSGGPEEPSFRQQNASQMFFNTRANSPTLPHTGSWNASTTGSSVNQVLLPFATPAGNAEGTDFLINGPFNGNFLTVDFPNGRVLRASPPFSTPQTGTNFIIGLSAPNGLAIDPLTGDVFVAESFTGVIKRFSNTGAPVGTGIFAVTGFTNRKIAFDDLGNLYVATVDGPVLKFSPAGVPTTIGSVPGGNGIAVCQTPDNK
jgi:hypothetical protein